MTPADAVRIRSNGQYVRGDAMSHKLTLLLDDDAVAFGKQWARRHLEEKHL